MRLSASKNDEAFHPQYAEAGVTLNGTKLTDCITADEERGYCICFARDDAGNFIDDGNECQTEMRCGVVKIDLPTNWIPDAVEV